MTALASDAFTRANSGTLGANWTDWNTGGTFSIASNTAVPGTLGADSVSYYSGIAWANDQYAKALFSVGGTGGGAGPGLAVRILAGSTQTEGTGAMYFCLVNHAASNNIEIWKLTAAGGFAQLATLTQAFSNGDTFELDIQGTTLTTRYNGGSIDSRTDSSITSGNAGLFYSSTATTPSVDNWEGGDFSSAAAQTPYNPWLQRAPLLAS